MKITENIHALKHNFIIPLSPEIKLNRFVYSFIIFEEHSIHLVDSGVIGSAEKIFEYINKQGRNVNEIKNLILTHSHPDHIGSAAKIKDETSCKIFAHQEEREWIEDIDKQLADRPVPGFKTLVNRSVTIDLFLNDGELINFESSEIKITHTPGHSKGSISILFPKEKVLISADSILLPGDLPIYENYKDTLSSIRKLKEIKDIEILLSSWAEPVYKELIPKIYEDSCSYLKSIDINIKSVPNGNELPPMELCKIVVEKMKFPAAAINPLVAKSFQSNL